MSLMLSMFMSMIITAYLLSFGIETDYAHFDVNGDLDLNFHS